MTVDGGVTMDDRVAQPASVSDNRDFAQFNATWRGYVDRGVDMATSFPACVRRRVGLVRGNAQEAHLGSPASPHAKDRCV